MERLMSVEKDGIVFLQFSMVVGEYKFETGEMYVCKTYFDRYYAKTFKEFDRLMMEHNKLEIDSEKLVREGIEISKVNKIKEQHKNTIDRIAREEAEKLRKEIGRQQQSGNLRFRGNKWFAEVEYNDYYIIVDRVNKIMYAYNINEATNSNFKEKNSTVSIRDAALEKRKLLASDVFCTCGYTGGEPEYVTHYMGVNHGWVCKRCKRFVQIG